jgi:hypothetical protein
VDRREIERDIFDGRLDDLLIGRRVLVERRRVPVGRFIQTRTSAAPRCRERGKQKGQKDQIATAQSAA